MKVFKNGISYYIDDLLYGAGPTERQLFKLSSLVLKNGNVVKCRRSLEEVIDNLLNNEVVRAEKLIMGDEMVIES